jgi:hypothetical protein
LYDKEEPEDKKEKKVEKSNDQSNPFLALVGAYNSGGTSSKPGKKDNSRDSKIENEYIMPALRTVVKETAFNFFEIYKKVHGMAAFP